MSTLLNGTSQQIVFSVPASGPLNVNGANTLLILWRIVTTSDLTWLSGIETETSAAAASATIGRHVNGTVYWSNGTAEQNANTITDSDGWMLNAGRKTSGSTLPTLSRCIIGGANTHTVAGGTRTDPPSIASGTIRIGGNDDFANVRVAAAAIFNKVLTDAEINGVNTAKTTQSIYDLTPVCLADDDDSFGSDLMGNATFVSNNGTSDGDNPSGWVYGIGGGGPITDGPKLRFVRSALRW